MNMNAQHFFDFLLQNGKNLPIHREYIGDEDWFTSEIVFNIDAPVTIVNGVYSLVRNIPEQIEKFNIQFSLNSQSMYRSKVIEQALGLDVDLSTFDSFDAWSADLLVRLQRIIFEHGIYNSFSLNALEPQFKQAYQEWLMQTPTLPMQYSTQYMYHIFDNAELVHKYIVDIVGNFTKGANN